MNTFRYRPRHGNWPPCRTVQTGLLTADASERYPGACGHRHLHVDEESRMHTTDRSRVIHLAEAQLGIPGPAGEHAVVVLQHGSLDVKLSFPERPNRQTPHEQDEVYLVIRGRGVLSHDGKRDRFEPGD